MDPNKSLAEALAALASKDRVTALELLHGLVEWLDKGGFLPEVENHADGYNSFSVNTRGW